MIYKPATVRRGADADLPGGDAGRRTSATSTSSPTSSARRRTSAASTTKNLDRYWCPTDRKNSLSGTGTDYVGVWMKIEHPWLTKMFGNTKTLTDSSVIRIEPRKK